MLQKSNKFEFTRSEEFYKVSKFLLRLMFVSNETDTKNVTIFKISVVFWIAIPILIGLASLQVVFIYDLFLTGFDFVQFCYAETCFRIS